MIDSEVATILWTVFIDASILLGALLVFFCLRKQRGDTYNSQWHLQHIELNQNFVPDDLLATEQDSIQEKTIFQDDNSVIDDNLKSLMQVSQSSPTMNVNSSDNNQENIIYKSVPEFGQIKNQLSKQQQTNEAKSEMIIDTDSQQEQDDESDNDTNDSKLDDDQISANMSFEDPNEDRDTSFNPYTNRAQRDLTITKEIKTERVNSMLLTKVYDKEHNEKTHNKFFNWVRVLWQIDDNEMVWINGVDYTLYLIYLRYCACLFAVISFVDLVLVIPIYVRGDPMPIDDYKLHPETESSLQGITVLNITATSPKIAFIFCLVMFWATGSAFLMLYFYYKKSHTWKSERDVTKDLMDVDIAHFTLMITNLPKDAPVDQFQKRLLKAFKKMFPDTVNQASSLISVRVIGNYNKLYEKVLKLKRNKDKMQFVQHQNLESGERKMIRKRAIRNFICHCKCSKKVDALSYYTRKVSQYQTEVNNLIKQKRKGNSGIGFVMFQKETIPKKLRSNPKEFRERAFRSLSTKNINKLKLLEWGLNPAFSQSDIIWTNLSKDTLFSTLKTFFLLVILFIISVLLMTPLMFLDMADEIRESLENRYGDSGWLSSPLITTYLSSLSVLLFNLILIPFFIDMMVLLEDHQTKSARQVAILNRNFFFMFINSFFLPLTTLGTIKSFLAILATQNFLDLPQYLAQNLLTTYDLFIKYFIQLTFISVGFWLLDIPHLVVKSICKCCHNRRNKERLIKKEFVDTYAYDLGYHQSYALVTFAIAMVFSIFVPLVPFFGMIFFVFKYYVDKYNLTFVYNSEFLGVGLIRKRVIPYSILCIYIFQFLNVGFFSIKGGVTYITAGLTLIGLQSLGLIIADSFLKKQRRKKNEQLQKKENLDIQSQRTESMQIQDRAQSEQWKPNQQSSKVQRRNSQNYQVRTDDSYQPTKYDYSFQIQADDLDIRSTLLASNRQTNTDETNLQNDVQINIEQNKLTKQDIKKNQVHDGQVTLNQDKGNLRDSLLSNSQIDQNDVFERSFSEAQHNSKNNQDRLSTFDRLDVAMSQKNIQKIKKAYRHPFEFISPKLYQDKSILLIQTDQKLAETQSNYLSEDLQMNSEHNEEI